MGLPIQTLQRADRALGAVAFRLLGPLRHLRRRAGEGAPERVLLVKFWGLGSLQLLTPAVAALRRRHPGATIELLTLRGNEAFARGLGVFDGVLTLDVDAGWAGVTRRIAGLLRELRARRYGVVYDFEFFTYFSGLVSLASGAPRSVGFSSIHVSRGGLHTDWVPFRRSWHVARNFRSLAGGEDGHPVAWEETTPYPVDAGARAEAAALLLEEGATSGPLVVLNPNAGELSLERRWPPERFAELARTLVLEDGARVALIGAPGERGRTREVAARAGELPPGALSNLAGRLSLATLCALFEEADCVVTNDSGPMHVAAALGAPTLGLFGPETPQLYRPLGPRARWLWSPPSCSPCLNVHENKLATCVRGLPECMTNLSVGAVLAAVRDELRAPRPRRTAQRN